MKRINENYYIDENNWLMHKCFHKGITFMSEASDGTLFYSCLYCRESPPKQIRIIYLLKVKYDQKSSSI